MILICSAISLACGAFALFGYSFQEESIPISFTSEFEETGDIEFKFADSQQLNISPLCGCYEPQKWEDWRGVSFVAKNFKLERNGSLPVTGYLIFSNTPEEIKLWPTLARISGQFKLIDIPETDEFSPDYFLSPSRHPSYEVQSESSFTEGYLQWFTKKGLNVALLGDKPLAALIPTRDSSVSVKFVPGQFPGSASFATVTESYEKEKTPFNKFGEATFSDIPTIDALGPNTLLWSEDESSYIDSDSSDVSLPAGKRPGKKRIKAVLLNPPFASRIVAYGFENQDLLGVYDGVARKTRHGTFVNGRRQEKAGEPLVNNYRIAQRLDDGKFDVRIEDPLLQASEFSKIYEGMKQSNVTQASFSTISSSDVAGGVMEFRYPPIPPNNGFNIFGRLRQFKLLAATGTFQLGSRTVGVPIPSEIDLRGVRQSQFRNGVLEIPLQFGMTDELRKIQMKATSEVWINGESITRRADNNKTTTDYVVLFATIAGAVIGVVSLLFSVLALVRG